MASALNCCLRFIVLISALTIVNAEFKPRPESFTCRLLNSNYVNAESLLEYPIVFEPIKLGRLTIWSGSSTLPGSGFKCYAGKNGTNIILMDFANFVDKLEWTVYDANLGTTFHGISVNHRENVVFKIYLDNNQARSHLNCNRITLIEAHHEDDRYTSIRSACEGCRSSVIPFVNSHIRELFKLRLEEHIMDGLYWHLSSMISSQHFSGPIEL